MSAHSVSTLLTEILAQKNCYRCIFQTLARPPSLNYWVFSMSPRRQLYYHANLLSSAKRKHPSRGRSITLNCWLVGGCGKASLQELFWRRQAHFISDFMESWIQRSQANCLFFSHPLHTSQCYHFEVSVSSASWNRPFHFKCMLN